MAHNRVRHNNQEIFPCGSRTDTGRVRSHNEDSLLAVFPLFAVADGMGGHEAGEVASEIAIETLAAHAPKTADKKALGRAVCAANRAVIRAALHGEGRPGMGTTMTAAVLSGNSLVIAQCGDSRAYVLFDGRLQQITRDHSLVADMVKSGQITEEEARVHPKRSVITRALGSDPNMEPDLYEVGVREGDRLLLCSDGLSSMIKRERIEEILNQFADPQEAADVLVSEACAAGGLDNITVIVVDVKATKNPEAEKKYNRKRIFMISAWILAAIAAIAICFGAFMLYANNTYYVADNDGYVTVYRGMPDSWMGIKFSWEVEKTDIKTETLPASTEQRLATGITVGTLDDVETLISSYREYDTNSDNSDSSNSSSNTNKESSDK